MRASYCCLLFKDLQVLACIAIKDSKLSKTYIYLFILESLINCITVSLLIFKSFEVWKRHLYI